MFAAKGSLSSKRIVGFGCFILIAEMVQATLWANRPIPSELLYTLAGVMLTCFGMNAAIDMQALKTKSDVASDIVKEKPSGQTADDAKDVLNSPKP